MKSFISILLILFHSLYGISQVNTDSLLASLNQTTIDKNSLQQALDRLNATAPEERGTIMTIGNWIIQNSRADSLLEINALANLSVGKKFTIASSFADATLYLTRAQRLSEKHNFPIIHAQTLNALGSIYDSNDQEEKAIEFYTRSLELSKQINYQHGMARAYYNLGRIQLTAEPRTNASIRSSIHLMRQGLDIVKQIKDTQSIITQTRGLASAYVELKNYEAALEKLNQAEQLMQLKGREYDYVLHHNEVAKIYHEKKKYSTAIQHYETGLDLAQKLDMPRLMCMYYSGMAETYAETGNYKKANEYNQLNIKMHDALVSRENFAAAADIQNRYERAKKDNQLLKLATENKQRSTLILILVGATAGLLLIAILGFKIFKSRNKIFNQQQEIQRQQIKQLEKDQQLISIDAMLKGQEEERSRIAKDLHDGIGSLLSGTKLSFMNVRENLGLESDKAVLFDKSLSMLDNTIGDLRKVAQNLMPEALVKFGLQDALRDFCDAVETSTGIKMHYHQLGEKRKLDSTAEIFIYRIIQELVNNIVKHAGASEVMVQLSMTKDTTVITVEDDGSGFDKKILATSKGAGMSNIHYRVQYFNGSSDIVTSPGNGTSITIHLKV